MRRFRSSILFVSLLMPFTAQSAAAQASTVVVAGTVVDQTVAAIPTASVAIRRGSASSGRRVDVQGLGFFKVNDLVPGDYEVTATSPGLRLDGALFRMDYENQIVPANLAGGIGATLTNGGTTLHQGLEVSARVDTAALLDSAHNTYLRVAYTFAPVARFAGMRFIGISGFQTVSVSGNRLPYAPEQLLTIGIGYAHPIGLDVIVGAIHTSDQFGDDLNTAAPTPDGTAGAHCRVHGLEHRSHYDIGRATVFLTGEERARWSIHRRSRTGDCARWPTVQAD